MTFEILKILKKRDFAGQVISLSQKIAKIVLPLSTKFHRGASTIMDNFEGVYQKTWGKIFHENPGTYNC